jgi:hypothetical protein
MIPIVIYQFAGIPSRYFSVYTCKRIYWRRKPEYPEKTTNLSQVTDKLYHKKLYRVNRTMSGILTYNISGGRH